MADLQPEELFPGVDPQQPIAAETLPASVPEAIVSEPWRAEIDSLKQLLSMVVQQQAQPRQEFQQLQPPQPSPYKNWEPQTVLSKADALAMLTAQDPTDALNGVFNKLGEKIYNPLIDELKKRDNYIAGMQMQTYQQQVQAEQMARAQANSEKFYKAHPEIEPYRELVPLEAQAIAAEAQQNPYLYTGKGEKDIHDLLANRITAKVKGYAQSLQTVETPIGSTGNAPKTFMERGSGVRPGQPAKNKDANQAALSEMSKFLSKK